MGRDILNPSQSRVSMVVGAIYHNISNIMRKKYQNINDFSLVFELPFAQSIKASC